jgi:(p)ppGpp synthase/HD superfamily hydrolase
MTDLTPTTTTTTADKLETHETFFAGVIPWMAPRPLMDVQVAYTIAKAAHRYQFRRQTNEDGTQQRYFEHPRRVALYLLDRLEVTDPEMIITALLHDSLEDTRITAEMIAHLFGQNVAKSVKLLSKLPKEGYYERLLKFGDENVATVKLADRIDNLSSMTQLDLAFQGRQREETKEHIYPLLRFVKNEQTRKILMDDLVARTEPKVWG